MLLNFLIKSFAFAIESAISETTNVVVVPTLVKVSSKKFQLLKNFVKSSVVVEEAI